ncbi:MAG: maleylpyruvate isomerase family mycothiol-dependent enzyme [Acidimicrobiia bacterium]
MPTDQELVDQLEAVWSSIEKLGSGLSDAEWAAPTECPGWSVKDNVSHIIGIEAMSLGRAAPERELGDPPHVKNDIGRANEMWVDNLRDRSGPEVLDEYRNLTSERIAGLRALDEAGFFADSWTPAGPGTVRDLIPFRVFDSWVHEQDMRRAIHRPGDLDGPVARAAFERVADRMGYVVGKKVNPPDGTSVVFDLVGPLARPLVVGVDGGRAHTLDPPPAEPTVRLKMSDETFCRLGCGRIDPAAALSDGRVVVSGDAALGLRVTESMNFLF